MKKLFVPILFLITFIPLCNGNEPLLIIAQRLTEGSGDKIHSSQYKVIKGLNKTLNEDTIEVEFYHFQADKTPLSDTVLLEIYPSTNGKDSYLFKEYNAEKGVKKVQLETIDTTFWQACEAKKEVCKPIVIHKNPKKEKCYLIMPCGGAYVTIILSDKGKDNTIKEIEIEQKDCAPVMDLTDIPDGIYDISMYSCGLGGTIELILNSSL